MTIDNMWLSCFKTEAPQAYSEKPKFHANAVFSDGQIRLMQSPPVEPQTWDDYIFHRFLRYYGNFLKQVDTLVVAFDNYQYVPPAKCMTQTSRRKHIPGLDISETSPLPCMVPEGESWTQCISNRAFKVKVIDLLVMRLPGLLLKKYPTKTVIIDYDVPIKYTMDAEQKLVQEVMSDIPPQGEADVKFPKWCDMFQKVIIDSIDGDSVPIALIHHERLLQEQKCPPKVAIYRMYTRNYEERLTVKLAPKMPEEGVTPVLEPFRKRQKRAFHTYEYLDVHTLFVMLKEAVAQTIGRESTMVTHDAHVVRMIVALVILTGTDYTRHLPQMSGKSIWAMLPVIWIPLMMSYDVGNSQMKPVVTCDALVGKFYAEKYFKHVSMSSHTYEDIYRDIMRSKVCIRTKETLPSVAQIRTTVKNCNWMLKYWTCQEVPNPLSGEYGYVMVNKKTKYEDTV